MIKCLDGFPYASAIAVIPVGVITSPDGLITLSYPLIRYSVNIQT